MSGFERIILQAPLAKTTQPSRAVNLISGFLIENGNSHKYSCSLVLVNN